MPVAQPTEIGLRHGLTAPFWALLIVVLTVGGAACGNSSSTGSHAAVPVAFQRKALAVCKAAAAQKKAEGPFPYPKFNPTRPDWSSFPGVADALIKTPEIFRTWQRNMQALGEPSTGRAAWDDLLAAIDSHVRIASEQQAAAARRDSQTFIKDYNEGANTQEELLRAANAAGVAGCAAVDR